MSSGNGKLHKNIILKSTGAIGDLVIASALPAALSKKGSHTGIVSKGFTLPLWWGLKDNSSAYAFGTKDSPLSLPKHSVEIDLSDYLAGMPHSKNLPADFSGEERKAHLCEWMAYSVFKQSRIRLDVSRDDVRIKLTKEEQQFGISSVHNLSHTNGNKPVVIFAPYSNTKNRNLPKLTLEKIVKAVSDWAVPCLLQPYGDEQYIEGTTPVGDKDLRKASAIMYAVDAYVGVDSGPLHMINGALQGTDSEYSDSFNHNQNKIIIAIGSSNPDVISYQDNVIVQAEPGVCEFAPCGAHGYYEVEKYGELFKAKFNTTGKDKSGCVCNNYDNCETASCMESVSADEIIHNLELILKK